MAARGKTYLYFVCLALALGIGAAWWNWSAREHSAPTQSVASGRRASPQVELINNAGGKVDLSDLKGNVVVVHFWASWCPPCLEEIGNWVKAAESYSGKPVKFVAVSLDERWEDAWKYLPKTGLPASVISTLDPEKKASDAFGSYQFPETYFLDRNLRIAQKLVGTQDWESERVRGWINALLAESR